MNFRLILNIMGYTLWVEAGCLLLPLLVSVGYGEACWEPFLWTLGLCSLWGMILTGLSPTMLMPCSRRPLASPPPEPPS